MSGNQRGADKAVRTKIERYGPDVFSKNGKRGGKARNASSKRFSPFSDVEFAAEMGRRGSAKRWSKEPKEGDE
jgi:hypothetical protein